MTLKSDDLAYIFPKLLLLKAIYNVYNNIYNNTSRRLHSISNVNMLREVHHQNRAGAHTQRNVIKSNRNQIVFTIFRLIWNQTDVRLVPNQPGMVNTIRFRFDLIRFGKISLRVWLHLIVDMSRDILKQIRAPKSTRLNYKLTCSRMDNIYTRVF